MKKLTAHYVFPVSSEPIKNGIIVVNSNNEIVDIYRPKNGSNETNQTIFYNGILVPGFVNAHCHLELSHFKNKISPKGGLGNFIVNVVKHKMQDSGYHPDTFVNADDEMKKNGIVAVGDISNTNNSFEVKKNSSIRYRTFIEVYSFDASKAKSVFDEAEMLYKELQQLNLPASIVPHAPYSLTEELFLLVKNHAEKTKNMISYHNQETATEADFFRNKSGNLYESLCKLGADFSHIKKGNNNSLESVINWFDKSSKTMLIHNTYSTDSDIKLASSYFKELFWCLCPNSNLFIEDSLPDIDLFIKNKQSIVLGTDSYCSNTALSILEEMKTINLNFHHIDFSEILRWATINGAKALGFDNTIGSFEYGKKPGINLIENFDFEKMALTEKSSVTKVL